MFNVRYSEYFFTSLENFTILMRRHYYGIFSDTWIHDLDKILTDYSSLYKIFQEEILVNIDLLSKNWLLWRKVINKIWEIENCVLTFKKRSYSITFFALRDSQKNEIVVYNISINAI